MMLFLIIASFCIFVIPAISFCIPAKPQYRFRPAVKAPVAVYQSKFDRFGGWDGDDFN